MLIIFSLFLYTAVLSFLFKIFLRNIGSFEVFKHALLLLASIIPIFCYIFTLQGANQKSELNYCLLTDKEATKLDFMNSWLDEKYRFHLLCENSDPYKLDGNRDKFSGGPGMDLVEKMIIGQISSFMPYQWDMSYKSEPLGVFFEPIDTKAKRNTVSNDELKKIFSNNKIIAKEGAFPSHSLSVPPNSVISSHEIVSDSEGNYRLIRISNGDFELKIKIQCRGLMYQPSVAFGFGMIPDNDDITDIKSLPWYNLFSYRVSINTNISWTAPSLEKEKYLRWSNNITNLLKEMDWETLKSEYKKTLIEKATSKILHSKINVKSVRHDL